MSSIRHGEEQMRPRHSRSLLKLFISSTRSARRSAGAAKPFDLAARERSLRKARRWKVEPAKRAWGTHFSRARVERDPDGSGRRFRVAKPSNVFSSGEVNKGRTIAGAAFAHSPKWDQYLAVTGPPSKGPKRKFRPALTTSLVSLDGSAPKN
jgi:hypothetical protein